MNKYKRLTTKINGYAHGKVGKSIQTAIKNKVFARGCFECTGLVERLFELEDQLEKGILTVREFKYDMGKEVYFLLYEHPESTQPCCIEKGKIEARLQDGLSIIYRLSNPNIKAGESFCLYERELYGNEEQAKESFDRYFYETPKRIK